MASKGIAQCDTDLLTETVPISSGKCQTRSELSLNSISSTSAVKKTKQPKFSGW